MDFICSSAGNADLTQLEDTAQDMADDSASRHIIHEEVTAFMRQTQTCGVRVQSVIRQLQFSVCDFLPDSGNAL